MNRTNWGTLAVLLFLAVAMSACAPLRQYRPRYDLCVNTGFTSPGACDGHALQEFRTGSKAAGNGYLLGYVELDDQGMLFDRKQMDAVITKLYEETAEKDLLMVVFVHGWKHSAAPGDGNIATFRKVLQGLADAENRLSRSNHEAPRRVAGVYLGWRGGSLTVPGVENLTFWERKNTAQKVGHGGMTEILNRLERVKQDKDSTAEHGASRTRLVVVGHSFGGHAVYSALSQILESRFVHTVGPSGIQTNTQGFGDLVVLINPAFEAVQYTPLSDMAAERGSYFDTQLPVLAVLTSEADYATKIAFPLGRRFSTFFEKERDMKRWNATSKKQETIDEEDANVTAVGHFDPYRTHFLRATTQSAESAAGSESGPTAVQDLLRTFASWRLDQPGSKIPFDGSLLERTSDSAGRNPYLVIRVDGQLIEDHNDIADPRVIEFIKQLILVSSQSPKTLERTHSESGIAGSR